MAFVIDRNKFILESVKEGKSQADIAQVLKISRQRVQQIEKKLGVTRRDIEREKVRVYQCVCSVCGKKFTSPFADAMYCCQKCYREGNADDRAARVAAVARRKERNRVRARFLYQMRVQKGGRR